MIDRKDLIAGNMFVASDEASGIHSNNVFYKPGEMLMFLRTKTVIHSWIAEVYVFYRLRTMCSVEWLEGSACKKLNKLIP